MGIERRLLFTASLLSFQISIQRPYCWCRRYRRHLYRHGVTSVHDGVAASGARVFIKSTATVYFSFVGLLLDFIQINQGAAESPFKTHPKSMLASLMSACIYSLALVLKEIVELEGQQIIGENYARIFCYVTLIVAGLTPVSLVSVLVPDSLIWLPYGIWFIFSVIVVRFKAWDLFTGFLPAQIADPDNELHVE
ncbi:unnamed protein product [Camellia sinensis]